MRLYSRENGKLREEGSAAARTDNQRFSKAAPLKNVGANELFRVAEPVLEEYEGLF